MTLGILIHDDCLLHKEKECHCLGVADNVLVWFHIALTTFYAIITTLCLCLFDASNTIGSIFSRHAAQHHTINLH